MGSYGIRNYTCIIIPDKCLSMTLFIITNNYSISILIIYKYAFEFCASNLHLKLLFTFSKFSPSFIHKEACINLYYFPNSTYVDKPKQTLSKLASVKNINVIELRYILRVCWCRHQYNWMQITKLNWYRREAPW